MVGGVTLGLAGAGIAGIPAQAIDSNPPTGPGNVEVFPKRDMVAIEGYTEYAGKEATFTVTRGDTVIGSAVGTVDSTGFLEVNHPGGSCWGEGTDVKVTPDIQGGDEIRVDFADTGGKWDGAITQDVVVTDVVRRDDARQLVITGTYGPDVDMPGADLVTDPGRFEVEIVNPDMRTGTSRIGERAIGWPVEAEETTPGYTVTGTVTGTDVDAGEAAAGGTFEVIYTFDAASDLDLAEAGEIVGLAWQADAPVEFGIEAEYGLTLYEFHEASGPGMGGCPAGPQEMRPNAPTVYTAQGAGAGSIAVTWGEGTTLPAAPGITGYSVTAVRSVSDGVDAGGLVRVDADARSATVEGLTAGEIYDVEIASRSSAGDSAPAIVRVRAADHIVPTAEATTTRQPNAFGKYAPLVTTANGDFGIHLDPVPGLIGAEVHYTVDGSTPMLDSPTFVPGESDSLQIRQNTTVRWIVVDSGNIVGPEGSRSFEIADGGNDAPAAPTAEPVGVDGVVEVTFDKVDDPTVVAYRVQAYEADSGVRIGTPLGVKIVEGDTLARRVPGLTNGTEYTFTVAARYGKVWSAESDPSNPVAPTATPRAVTSGPESALRGRVVTLDGTNSVGAVGYRWVQVRPWVDGYRDPAVTLSNATTEQVTFRVPILTSPTSDDGELEFRLIITLADGTKRSTLTTVTATPDAVVAEEARWRTGDEIGGTGSQENATLTLLNGSATGAFIGQAIVIDGEWEYPGGAPALPNGQIYVWSDYGYTGVITTTD